MHKYDALDAVAHILGTMKWNFDYNQELPAIWAAFRVEGKHYADLCVGPHHQGRSLIMFTTLPFDASACPPHLLRQTLDEKTRNLTGITMDLRPAEGLRLKTLFWIPGPEFLPRSSLTLVEPYLRSLLNASSQIFPHMLRFLHPELLRSPRDDFHLPS